MELRSGSQKSAEPHTPKPRAAPRSSGHGIVDGDEPSRADGECDHPMPASPVPESVSVAESRPISPAPVAIRESVGAADSSPEAVEAVEAPPVPVSDVVLPAESLMTDPSTGAEQPTPIPTAPSEEAVQQLPPDSANILTCVLSLMHMVSKAAQKQQSELGQDGGGDLQGSTEGQAACPNGHEEKNSEAKEGEGAAVATSATSETGMECCEAEEGEEAQGAEPMAVEEEKEGQASGGPEEAGPVPRDGEAGEHKGDEDMMQVGTGTEAAEGAVVEAQDGQADAEAEAVEAEGGLAGQLAQERAEKDRLRSALVECSALGRREASSLRAFQESLRSWALQRMNECTADVARLGGRLIGGWEAEQKRISTLESLLRKETQRRRKLFNDLQAMRGNIRVFCRVRPPKPTSAGAAPPAVTQSSCSEVSLRSSPAAPAKSFELDNVFGPTSTQAEVWSEVEGLVTSVMDGYQACILAYGQTGSGKTYTMEGSEEDPGINTRALQQLFALKETKEASALVEVKVEVSMVEIYNESVRDLLADPSATTSNSSSSNNKAAGTQATQHALDIRQGEQGVYVQGARTLPVSSLEDVRGILRSGQRMRATCSTRANASSSRSHSLLLVSIKTTDHATHLHTSGRLILVDLAGSERLSKTGAEGQALKEAQNINRSLSALGDVIAALRNKQEFKGSGKGAENQHVPYRNSKLTFLLQDALGADNKALMIVQVSPDADDAGESLCSLNFAARVNGVQLGATRHLKGDTRFFRDALSRLRSEAKDLEAKNKDANATIAALHKDLAKAREEAESRGKEGSASVSALQAQLTQARAAEQTANDKCEVLLERIEQLRRDMATEKSTQAARDVATEEERAAAIATAQRQAAALQQDKDRLQEAIAAKDQELAAMQRTLASLSSLSTLPPPAPAPTATPLHKPRAPPPEPASQALSPPADTMDASFLMQSAQKQLRAALGGRGEAQRSGAITRAPPPPCAIYQDDDENDEENTEDMAGLREEEEEEVSHARPRSAYVGTPRKPSGPSQEGEREARHAKRPLPKQDAENMPPTDAHRLINGQPNNRAAGDQQPAKRTKKVTFMLPPPSPEVSMDLDDDDAPSGGPGNGQPLQQHRALEPISENVLMNLQHPNSGAFGTDQQVPSFEPASSHRVTPYKRRPSFLAPTAASSAPPVPPPAPPLTYRTGPSNALGTATRIQQAAPPTPSRLKKPARVPNAQAPNGPPSRMSLGGAKLPGQGNGGRWR